MNNHIITLKRLTIVVLFVATTIVSAYSSSYIVNLDSVLEVLDREILARQNYYDVKESHIDAIRSRLKPEINDRANFNVLDMLYSEFRQYQSDSAFLYSRKLETLAKNVGDSTLIAIAASTRFDYFVSLWQLDEAIDAYNSIEEARLPVNERILFYKNCVNLFYRLAMQSKEIDERKRLQYDTKCTEYKQNIVNCAAPGTFDSEFYKLSLSEIDGVKPHDAIEKRFILLDNACTNDHERALLYASLSSCASLINEKRLAAYCFALSAISDIRSATHETASVLNLANIMNEFDDNERAVRYIMVAFDDALFFNSRIKQSQIGMILPLIESMRYDSITNRHHVMRVILVCISLLFCVSGVLLFLLYKRNTRLESMRKSLHDTQDKLVNANDKLSSLNTQLKETIELKDRYIMQSLNVNLVYLRQVETRCREAINKMKTKGLEAVRFLPYQMGIKEERQRIMQSFDHTFQQVFPNFIDEFNALLLDDQAIVIGEDGSMPTELRIFALMRLGITETSAVADFLNISPNAIYVYKSRIKAKSRVPKADFDAYVMGIPKP